MPQPHRIVSRSPLAAALAVVAIVLAVSLARWESGSRPRFPLEHSNVAYSLASGLGYSNPFGVQSGPTAWVPPGLPLAYAGAIEVARALRMDERIAIVAFNLLAAASAAFLVLRFCIGGWRPVSRLAFCAAFVGYGLLDRDFLVSTGPLTAAGCGLLLAGLSSAIRRPGGPAPWLLLFCANALLAVTHPGLALAGAAASAAVGLGGLRTEAGRSAGIARSAAFAALAGIAATAVPWTIRNRLVFHQWIPAKSNGAFELVLSQRETDDGVLTESGIVVGHPSTNPRLLADYARLGEAPFLAPYRREAAGILTGETGRYALFSLNRLFNAICLCDSPADIEPLSVRVPPAEAGRLVGRRVILQCAGTPVFFWARSPLTAAEERVQLQGLGVADPDAFVADFERAQATILGRTQGASARLTGFLWSGFPTACFLLAAAAGRFSRPRLVLGSGALYLVALVPNVLITHDIRHQTNFMLLFSVFVAGAAEAVQARRRGAPPGSGSTGPRGP